MQPGPSTRRWALALAVALASDAASILTTFAPVAQLMVDLATALALWGILGRRWVLLVALVPEAIPVVAVFPTWTLVVVALRTTGILRRRRLTS